MYLFFVDGGFDFDAKTGMTVAGGRYFWNPSHECVGQGEETRTIASRSDNILQDQYVMYPFPNATKLKCVVFTVLHILMRHPGTRFCFVTDVAQDIERRMAEKGPGNGLWSSLEQQCRLKRVLFVESERRDKLALEMKRAEREKKEQTRRRRHDHERKRLAERIHGKLSDFAAVKQ